jgi:hypothetical protein
MRADYGEPIRSAQTDPLTLFCHSLFTSLPRRDQRHWGEVYVRGLTTLPGRKSIRSISEQIAGGRAEQCLQQFVNQSPWSWAPVRRSLAENVAAALRPTAWVVREVAFPKNGDRSAGVARQYVDSLGRTLNCQLGLAVFMAGADGSCPVNWSLLLPPCWDEDESRRGGARLPDHQRSVARWRSVLAVIDELVREWRLPSAPIVMDVRRESQTESLLRALDQRELPYLLQVTPDSLSPARRLASRQCLTRRPGGAGTSRGAWLPSGAGVHPADVLGTLGVQRRVSADLALLADRSGLRDFEGRSYQGWHHHVTLVSIAHAYRLLHVPADDAILPEMALRSA